MEKIIKNKYFRLIPALLWMCFIFYLSSGQTSAIKGTSFERFLILKTFHLIEYAVLFVCFKIAGLSSNKSLIFSYIYAITDEIHQSFVPGRSALFRDTLIDLVGIILGYLILYFYRYKHK